MTRACWLFAALMVSIAGPLAAQDVATVRADMLESAAKARADGDFERAREILLPMVAASPDDPDLLRRLAMVEAGAGQLNAAKDRIEAASRLAPNDLDVALARGYILYWNGDVSEANRAAAMVSARDPDYPDLAQLQANLARQNEANGLRTRALSLGVGVSDITSASGASQTWNSQSLIAAFDVSGSHTATFGVLREDRGPIDTRLTGRIDRRIQGGFVYLAATVVPSSDFLERWSLGGGGEKAVADGLDALVDLRVADYDTGTIAALQPGLRYALDRNFSVSGRAINIFGGDDGYRLGGSVRLDYDPERDISAFLIGASYPDAEADGVRQLRSVAAGIVVPVADTFSLTAAGSHEDRDNSYRRWSGTLVLTYRPGAR